MGNYCTLKQAPPPQTLTLLLHRLFLLLFPLIFFLPSSQAQSPPPFSLLHLSPPTASQPHTDAREHSATVIKDYI